MARPPIGRVGLLGLAFALYLLWRRLSPQRERGAGAPAVGEPSVMARVGSATAPSEEIPPS